MTSRTLNVTIYTRMHFSLERDRCVGTGFAEDYVATSNTRVDH